MTKRAFRGLVLVSLALLFLGVVVELVSESSLPEPLRSYVQAEGEKELQPSDWLILAAVLVALPLLIAATLGLCFFKNWARWAYLVVCVVFVAFSPLLGPVVQPAWSAAFEDCSTILTGVILALSFFSPISAYFGGKLNPAKPERL